MSRKQAQFLVVFVTIGLGIFLAFAAPALLGALETFFKVLAYVFLGPIQ